MTTTKSGRSTRAMSKQFRLKQKVLRACSRSRRRKPEPWLQLDLFIAAKARRSS